MDVSEILEQMAAKARTDEKLKAQLLATEKAEKPLTQFARIAAQEGYQLSVMDLAMCGEEFHAAMKRSTNGGGENSPKLDCQEDFYGQFLNSIRQD